MKKKTSILSVFLFSIAVLSFLIIWTVSTHGQERFMPVRDKDSKYMQPEIVLAIKLAGSASLQKPVVVRTSKTDSGVTIVTFARPLSDIMVSPGQKATQDFLRISFNHDKVEMKPAEFFLKEEYVNTDDFILNRVAVLACSYMLKHKLLGNDFELEVNKIGSNYNVTATAIPYTPDAYVTVKISEKSGKLKIFHK